MEFRVTPEAVVWSLQSFRSVCTPESGVCTPESGVTSGTGV